MGLSINLNQAHRWRQHGSILAVYTWVNGERAIVLIPAYRHRAAWFVVCDSVAWEYDDPVVLAERARKACEVLGLEPSPTNWFKLASIIHDGLEDLIRMPHAPEPVMRQGAVIGQMVGRADGKVIHTEDIRLDQQEGVTYGV